MKFEEKTHYCNVGGIFIETFSNLKFSVVHNQRLSLLFIFGSRQCFLRRPLVPLFWDFCLYHVSMQGWILLLPYQQYTMNSSDSLLAKHLGGQHGSQFPYPQAFSSIGQNMHGVLLIGTVIA